MTTIKNLLSMAKGLLLSAIESNDPVVYLENLKLYRSIKGEVPEGYYTTPLDKAAVAKVSPPP